MMFHRIRRLASIQDVYWFMETCQLDKCSSVDFTEVMSAKENSYRQVLWLHFFMYE